MFQNYDSWVSYDCHLLTSHVIGLIAVIVYTILPGIALVPRLCAYTRLERAGLICAVSIGINAFALMMFSILGAYRPAVAGSWGVSLVVCTVVFYLRALRHRRKDIRPVPLDTDVSTASAARSGAREGGYSLHLLVLGIFAIQACKTWFFPFYTWDAIASWNRWARNYVVVPNYFQTERFFYPQYHSWSMSFPYMLMGDPSLEYYPHALSFAYVLVLYAGVARLARSVGAPGGLAFSMLFITFPIVCWVGSGYADDATTAFAILSIALYLESLQAGSRAAAFSRAGLAGFAAGTAFLFKQSSATITVMVPLLCTLLVVGGSRSFRFALGVVVAAGMVLVVTPWLLTPQSALLDPQLKLVLHDIHGQRSQLEILRQGLEMLIYSGTILKSRLVDLGFLCLVLLLVLFAMARSRVALTLGLASMLALAVWLNTANYDARALLPAVPVFIVLAASGLTGLTPRIMGMTAGRVVLGLFQVGCVSLYFFAERSSQYVYAGDRVFDWRPGERWCTVALLADQREKATELVPALGALWQWKALHPDFAGRFWSDPVVMAAFDPSQPNGGGLWLGEFFDDKGRPQWRTGDVLFMTADSFRNDRKPASGPGSGNGGNPSQTWEEWLASLEGTGQVRKGGRFGEYTEYELLAEP